ncbi:MAG: SIMPL domain-containing protein [Actinomycetota bacterium]|nr:SIMPL domain-containing protein [Actinomycetota bacterium]
MFDGIKVKVKRGFSLPVILLLATSSLILFAMSGCGGPIREKITIEGTGVGKAVPDEARITLSVVTDGKTVQEASGPTNEKTKAVVDAIKALGVEEKSIRTEALLVTPKRDDKGKIVGYTATNSIRVTTKKIDLLGQIIETSLNAGANDVSTLDMRVAEKEKAEEEGLRKAIENARRKAEVAAKTSGRRLGKVIQISQIYATTTAIDGVVDAIQPYEALTEIGAPPIQPGENEFTVTANVVFELR